MFIAGKSTEPMGDSLQNVFHGDRKVLGVDAGETFEEVGRMVIKPSAPGGGSSYWETLLSPFPLGVQKWGRATHFRTTHGV